jgi:glycosyltransferase involved in cell wall biosynthesis
VQSAIEAGRSFGTPIVICDDSTDDTNASVLKELRASYPHLDVIRNQRNLGIDENIVNAMNHCPARYGWLLGEDDLLLPDAIRIVRGAIERGPPTPFLFVNYAAVNEDYSRILKPAALALDEDREMDAAEFFENHGWAAGFIGACVIERAAWERVNVDRYIGTWFAHVGGIMEAARGRRVRLIARSLVWNRTGSADAFTWTGSMMNVLSGWKRLTHLLEPQYGPSFCRQAASQFERAHGLHSLAFLGYARAGGALTPELVAREIAPGDFPAAYKWCARAIARVPVSWCRAAHRVWQRLNSRAVASPNG